MFTHKLQITRQHVSTFLLTVTCVEIIFCCKLQQFCCSYYSSFSTLQTSKSFLSFLIIPIKNFESWNDTPISAFSRQFSHFGCTYIKYRVLAVNADQGFKWHRARTFKFIQINVWEISKFTARVNFNGRMFDRNGRSNNTQFKPSLVSVSILYV